MIIKKIILLFLLPITVLALDVTKHIEVLGNPYRQFYNTKEGIYSRNIWDMQLFDSKVYLGAGNSSNGGPSSNSGRTPVIFLKLKNNKFYKEYKVAEEQIDLYKVYKNNLYIPGHDATQKWTFGNFYVKSKKKKWKKYRTIPNALHVYDLVLLKDKLYVGLGFKNGGGVGVSSDNGKTWKIQKLSKGRIYSFIQLDDNLLAIKKFKKSSKVYFSVADLNLKYSNDFFPRFDITQNKMFPNTKLKNKSKKITRATNIKDSVIYLGAYKHNDHQSKPFGVYKANLKNEKLIVNKIKLKDNYIPRDILVRDDSVYILASVKKSNMTEVKVLKYNIKNIDKVEEILEFKSPTFARSFEEFNGDFYFGLGCDVKDSSKWKQKELKVDTGKIIKIKNEYIKQGL
ncbi:hypothetical protein [Sulfurimonas sp.]